MQLFDQFFINKMKLINLLTIATILFIKESIQLDFDVFENMCAACLNANPRFRYHCGVCTDDERREENLARENNSVIANYRKCGTEMTQKL